MNKTYRTVFSRIRGAMIVASELTRSHRTGKTAAAAVIVGSALAAAGVEAADPIQISVAETETKTYTDDTTANSFENAGLVDVSGKTLTIAIESSNKFSNTGTIKADVVDMTLSPTTVTCKSSKDHSKPRNEVDTSLKSPV